MNRDDVTGTFLSGGFHALEPLVDLPDPLDVTRGAVYRDDHGLIWRADRAPGVQRRPTAQWVRVAAVSRKQQRHDRSRVYVYGLAALVSAFAAVKLPEWLSPDAGYVPVLAVVMSAVFGVLCWTAADRLHRQVVLSPKDAAAGNGTDARLTREAAQTAERINQQGMREPHRTEAMKLSGELFLYRMKHGETTRLELGQDGIEGIEKVLHALAKGNFVDATVSARQLQRGTRIALSKRNAEPTSSLERTS